MNFSAPPKRGHIRRVELEPLAIFPFGCEAVVPILLDAGGVIRLDNVDCFHAFG